MSWISRAVFYFAAGNLIGLLKSWNKKAYFLFWIGCICLVVICGWVYGPDNLTNLKWYEILYNVAWLMLGSIVAEVNYKYWFSKK